MLTVAGPAGGSGHSGEKDSTIIAVSSDPAQQAGDRQSKLRNSCDRCQDTKLKCTQTKPACWRCNRMGLPCVYSPIRRLGRPRKNSGHPNSGASGTSGANGSGNGNDKPDNNNSNGDGGRNDNRNENRANQSAWRGRDDPLVPSLRTSPSAPSPTFRQHEAIPSPTDAFRGAIPGAAEEEGGSRTEAAPSSLQQSVIDPALSTTLFDMEMEELSTSDQASYELLFGVRLAEAAFEDFLHWPRAPALEAAQANSPVQQQQQCAPSTAQIQSSSSSSMASMATNSRPSSSVTFVNDGSASSSSAADPFTHHEGIAASHLGQLLPHTQSLPLSASSSLSSSSSSSSSSPSPPSCDSDCYGCLTRQLAGLNACMNDKVAPSVDAILQLERNMQSLGQRLLHCPTCLANPSSLLLLSIVVDQVVRLLERSFVERVQMGILASDHHLDRLSGRGGSGTSRHGLLAGSKGGSGGGGGGGGGGMRDSSSYQHHQHHQHSRRQSSSASGIGSLGGLGPDNASSSSLSHRARQAPAQMADLRIGDYEVLDEDFKLTFLKRLVRHRLSILVGMLTDLQQTISGQMNDVQCKATHQMVRGSVERVERLRGKMALKW